MALGDILKSLLGVSTYSLPDTGAPSLGDPSVEDWRARMGGQLLPLPSSQTRWYLSDLEDAEHLADQGDLSQAARLMRSARKDGIYAGVLSTRTDGLVRLPKKFRGDPEIVQALELGHESVRSVFDEMFPSTELALLAADGLELGVGVAELLPVVGRDYPVLVRLEPEFLVYRWNENRWYYRSIAGFLPITPGNGRWVLHTPGGRVAPWQHGIWRAVGRAYIRKEHAALGVDQWEAKLANPARVAVAPQGGAEAQKESWFRQVMAWGRNTVFGMTPGYDVKLLESNGRGADSFPKTIERQDREFVISVAGQVVTTDGGAGFQNSDIHKSIRSDLIQKTADDLSYTLNTQGIPPYVVARWGEDKLRTCAVQSWDTTPPKDRNAEAQTLVGFGTAVQTMGAALKPYGVAVDVATLASRFNVPIKGDANGDGVADEDVELPELESEDVSEDRPETAAAA